MQDLNALHACWRCFTQNSSGQSKCCLTVITVSTATSSTGTESAKEVGAVKAPTIWRSWPCKRFRPLASTSPSRFSKFMVSMLQAKLLSAGS